jgi:hypothetical protein
MTRSQWLAERRRAIALASGPSLMAATDFDQSGVFREYGNIYLGPSIGGITVPIFSNLTITAGGSYVLTKGTTRVSVNVAAPVTITLPPSEPVANGPPAIANPGAHINWPLTIADVGGNAQAWPITIQAVPGDTIQGLASMQITVNYGGYVFSTPIEGGPRVWTPVS